MVKENNEKPIKYELASHLGKDVILIHFEYDLELNKHVRKLVGVKWSRLKKAWYVLDTSQYRRKFGLPSKQAAENIDPINQPAMKKFIETLQLIRLQRKYFQHLSQRIRPRLMGKIMTRKLFILAIALFVSLTLKAQDKNYEEWYLTTKDSLNIFVKEIKSPSKDTVIVVHGGFGANHDYMLDAIKGLENKFHFVFYDQRGSLLSPGQIEKLTFQNNVNDLYELVKELKLKKVKLLCHSMGTLVGMEFAKLHPELVSNFVLTGAVISNAKNSKDVFSEQMGKNVDFLLNRPEVKNLEKYYKENKATLTYKEKTEYWRIAFAAVNIYDMSKWKLLKGGQIYYNQKASIMAETVNWDYDYRSLLNSLNTTIIQGQYDYLDFNLINYKEQTKEFKNIEIKLIPNAGHNSWIDNPTLFKKYLINGLTK